MSKREIVAREIRRAMLDNPTDGGFNARAAQREKIADQAADAILAALAAQQDADDRAGMLWWNSLSDDDRKKWVQPSGRTKDAWEVYKSDNRDGGREAWQPIETAPKDGTFILAVQAGTYSGTNDPYVPDVVRWFEGKWEDGWGDDDVRVYLPTHWRPLPAPPHS